MLAQGEAREICEGKGKQGKAREVEITRKKPHKKACPRKCWETKQENERYHVTRQGKTRET